jgi:hypothetical protein
MIKSYSDFPFLIHSVLFFNISVKKKNSVALKYYKVKVILLGGGIVFCNNMCAVIYDVFYFLDAAIYNTYSMARTRWNSFCQYSSNGAVTHSGCDAHKSDKQ